MELIFSLLVKLLLLLVGIVNALPLTSPARLVLGLFLTLAISFGTQITKDRRLILIAACAYPVLCFLLPECLYFTPLIVYDVISSRTFPAILFLPVLLLWQRPSSDLTIRLLLASGLAALLAFACTALLKLSQEIRELKDETDEEQIRLQREKKELMEQQSMETYAATLKERNRIAREIHDHVGHLLSRAILLSGALQTMEKEHPEIEPQLSALHQSLNDAMDQIRLSVHDLHDDSVDFSAAAETLLKDFTFCPVQFDCRCAGWMPNEIKYCLLSVLKEALVNITKHSDATLVEISVVEHPALYQMTIRDNGSKVTDAEKTKEHLDASLPAKGIGLRGMSTRVSALNGTIRFSADNGFRIFLTIPKTAEDVL